MALNGGSVTIAGDGTATGSGLSKELYDALLAKFGTDIPSGVHGAAGKQRLADMCVVIGLTVIAHFEANAVVTTTIGTGDAGLQRLPASLVENEPTKAPAASKTLSGTIT